MQDERPARNLKELHIHFEANLLTRAEHVLEILTNSHTYHDQKKGGGGGREAKERHKQI